MKQVGVSRSKSFIIGRLISEYFYAAIFYNFVTAVTHIINIQIIRTLPPYIKMLTTEISKWWDYG